MVRRHSCSTASNTWWSAPEIRSTRLRWPISGVRLVVNSGFALVWMLVAFTPARAAQSPQLWYTTPAASWSEALPIGNGRLAAMVFSGIDNEHLQLNEETIYAGKRMDRVNPGSRASIPVIRQLLLEGKVMQAQALAAKDMLAVPPRQPPFEPLGDLKISFDGVNAAGATNYRRSLDLFDGLLATSFDLAGAHYTREAFASYPDGAIVVHLKTDRPHALSFSVM